MIRSLLIALAVSALAAPAEAAMFRPATTAEAVAIVTADDAFVRGMTPSDLSIRLRAPTGGTVAALKAQYAGAVLAWSDADAARLDALVARSKPQLDALAPWLPETVLLIRAGEGIDGGLPHTRANAIVMGAALPQNEAMLEYVFFHELFHVLSRRASPQTRAELYALIGFERCRRVAAPPALLATGLSNPDVQDPAFVVEVDGADGPMALMPFLRAAPPRYDPAHAAFTSYFDLTFLRMRRERGGVCRLDGAPAAAQLSAEAVMAPLLARVGHNTGYVFHAEETLADNFADLMLGRTDLPDMWVLAALRERLARGPG